MTIRELSDDQLENLEQNYRKKGLTEGGKYSLREVLSEKLRRQGKNYTGRDVAKKILELAQSRGDGKVTYKELWKEYYPYKEWQGHASVSEVKAALGAAVNYCIESDLPLITSIVVQSGSGENSAEAKENMRKAAQEWGYPIHQTAEEFVNKQANETRKLDPDKLP
jgi:hypothetical protein